MTKIDQTEREALLPCPFCGGPADICGRLNSDGDVFCVVECQRCDAGVHDQYEINAIKAWNTRHTAAADVVERIKQFEEAVRAEAAHDCYMEEYPNDNGDHHVARSLGQKVDEARTALTTLQTPSKGD